MAVHTIYLPDLNPTPGHVVTILGEEAHHALRVKRLGTGDAVRLCNGRGMLADARLSGSRKERHDWTIDLEILGTEQTSPKRPRLRVLAAAPKGDRLPAMIEGLSQVGAAAWAPLVTQRTVVEPREGKLERLERIAVESMKQCGRAWVLEINEPVPFEAAVSARGAILADASGSDPEGSGLDDLTLLIGPEGGWTDGELQSARAAGARVVRFGPHIMRTEVAAVVGAAIVLGLERTTA
jgi:16S rRNA (uracil1498-N3)-methyltransferase